MIEVESVTLPVARFSKFQPLSSEFLDITNPKAVLENSLRNFACLSKNDIIAIKYNGNVYELRVLETEPDDAVTIIECDMNVSWASTGRSCRPTSFQFIIISGWICSTTRLPRSAKSRQKRRRNGWLVKINACSQRICCFQWRIFEVCFALLMKIILKFHVEFWSKIPIWQF